MITVTRWKSVRMATNLSKIVKLKVINDQDKENEINSVYEN